MQLKIKKLHPDAIIPKYATEGAACFDLHALGSEWDINSLAYGVRVALRPVTFRTGLAFEVPQGWAMLIYSRSSHGFKSDTRLANCVGVIDSDYRGEVMVRLTADGNGALNVNNCDRIAQAMLVPVERVEFVEVDDLSDTTRGTGGFGSTGS